MSGAVKCGKCSGSGRYLSYGVCFRCNGTGRTTKTVKPVKGATCSCDDPRAVVMCFVHPNGK